MNTFFECLVGQNGDFFIKCVRDFPFLGNHKSDRHQTAAALRLCYVEGFNEVCHLQGDYYFNASSGFQLTETLETAAVLKFVKSVSCLCDTYWLFYLKKPSQSYCHIRIFGEGCHRMRTWRGAVWLVFCKCRRLPQLVLVPSSYIKSTRDISSNDKRKDEVSDLPLMPVPPLLGKCHEIEMRSVVHSNK